jgi:hypothetical protein
MRCRACSACGRTLASYGTSGSLRGKELLMRSARSRGLTIALAIVGAFVAGAGAGQLAPRDALAQSQATASIYVPAGGLVFLAPDGTALARISRDANGGRLELFDDHHEVSVRVPRAAPTVSLQPPNPNAPDRDLSQTSMRDEVF